MTTPAKPAKPAEIGTKQLAIVAHQGQLELLDARWELQNGRTVKFRLVEGVAHTGIHPFKQFTRKRGGRVGSRFQVSFVPANGEPMMMEAMLAGGGEPLAQGQWVKFWLDDEADHHPFAGYHGRTKDRPGDIFTAVFVEIDDDETPVDQVAQKRLEHAHRKQGLSNYAALLSYNDNFMRYLAEKVEVSGELHTTDWWDKDDHIARFIRWKCEIGSRAELDSNGTAAAKFHDEIRTPFKDWYGVSGDG
jgi:hypothetical protein